MELIVFDLDGTLLDRNSAISDYTRETLDLLSQRDIAYTIATGRTLHGARAVLDGHPFDLPQAYKNGVLIWHPDEGKYSTSTTLTAAELEHVVRACIEQDISPFVFTLDDNHNSSVYHAATGTAADRELMQVLDIEGHVGMFPLDQLPPEASVTHVNSIGERDAIQAVVRHVEDEPQLVAYSGIAREGADWYWLDIHHSDASKGGAIQQLKELLGLERVICFGDSDNDLSMFEAADEAYAPANANDRIKAAATAVIGHHDEEGIARFLRQRFALERS